MTEDHGPASAPPAHGESPGPAPAAEQRIAEDIKDRASDLSHTGVRSGRYAAAAAGDQVPLGDAGQWLDSPQPGDVAGKMQFLARRKPAVVLVLAAGAGLVAGRLTRRRHARSPDPGVARVQDHSQRAGG
jgi:hypothetical protein